MRKSVEEIIATLRDVERRIWFLDGGTSNSDDARMLICVAIRMLAKERDEPVNYLENKSIMGYD